MEWWQVAPALRDRITGSRGLGARSLLAVNSRFPTGPPASVLIGTLPREERMPTRRARAGYPTRLYVAFEQLALPWASVTRWLACRVCTCKQERAY